MQDQAHTTELLTIYEVAAEWRVSVSAVNKLVRAGEFPNAFRAAGRRCWRIPRQDVQDYQKRNNQEA